MHFFSSPTRVFGAATLLRAGMLVYGLVQDAYSPVKYTDIDYQVFNSAAAFVSQGGSPYERETYRYTPLLAWLLLPCTVFASFGKVLFAMADLITGLLIMKMLCDEGVPRQRALKLASIWLLNPMVATISTRGSSEGLLAVMVLGMLYAALKRRFASAAVLLGLAVHFKIYPFIYGVSVLWWMDRRRLEKGGNGRARNSTVWQKITAFASRDRLIFAFVSLGTFAGLNALMYSMYGYPFLQHTFIHHVTRIDHRHNFSPYNIALYLSSASSLSKSPTATNPSRAPRGTSWADSVSHLQLESLAFAPQLVLSVLLIPLLLAKKDLSSAMLAQTFAFVTFNKVCTSQYFTWYLCLLPLYLPRSTLLSTPSKGIFAAVLWILTQAAWLQQGYQLEFLGKSTFVPGLWTSALAFFAVNCWILGVVITDVGKAGKSTNETKTGTSKPVAADVVT